VKTTRVLWTNLSERGRSRHPRAVLVNDMPHAVCFSDSPVVFETFWTVGNQILWALLRDALDSNDNLRSFEFHLDITAPFSASPNALIYPTESCGIAVPAYKQIYGTEAIISVQRIILRIPWFLGLAK